MQKIWKCMSISVRLILVIISEVFDNRNTFWNKTEGKRLLNCPLIVWLKLQGIKVWEKRLVLSLEKMLINYIHWHHWLQKMCNTESQTLMGLHIIFKS